MTADHPTREERYAAVLAEHTYMLGLKTGSICACGFVPTVDPSTLASQQDYHRAHVAAALVAADPAPDAQRADHFQHLYEQASEGKCGHSGLTIGACKATICDCFEFPWVKPAPGEHPDPAPAQPDAAWPCDNHGEPNTCLSLRKAEAECCRVCRIRAADRILHAAQPDAALSDVEQQVIAVLRSFWTHETPETLRPVAKALLAARATQPVPAPEVSGGVAEVRMLADEWDAEGADLIANCSTGRDVHEGETLRRCAASLRDALPADDGADCCRERTTAGGCGCGGGS